MARGRVGGSHSKIRGKVGDTVYSIVRNADGSYSQAESALPESKALALTPALAKQRMFMSIVMRHMNLLQVFMAAAFEDVPEGTLSVQEFARANVRWLQEHYQEDWPFNYKVWWPVYGTQIALPAPIIISKGTFRETAIYTHFESMTQNGGVVETSFEDMWPNQTFRQWLQVNRLGLQEYICDIHFTMGEDGNTPSYEYIRFNVNRALNLDRLCYDIDPSEFMITAGTIVGGFSWHTFTNDEHRRLLFTSERILKLRYMKGYATLQFGLQDGKWRQSNSQIRVPSGNTVAHHSWVSYEDAFQTWYDDRL